MNDARVLVLPATEHDPDIRQGSIFFIGTATVILRYAGFTILTDPNFLHQGEQVHLGYGLRSTRRTDPAIDIGELPPIDLIVLSHMHEDHFDRVAEQKLEKSLPIVTTRQAAAALKKKGFSSTHALHTWETLLITKGDIQLRITSMNGKQGVEALKILAPKIAIPIHFNDYTVFKSPLTDFVETVKAAGLQNKVQYLQHSETYTFESPRRSGS